MVRRCLQCTYWGGGNSNDIILSVGSLISYWGTGENLGYKNHEIRQRAGRRQHECAKGEMLLGGT